MQIVNGVVLGVDNSGPSCCLSAEGQKRLHRMSSSSRSLRQGWESVGLVKVMSGLFLPNFITPSSPNCTNMLCRSVYYQQCLVYEHCVLDPHSQSIDDICMIALHCQEIFY